VATVARAVHHAHQRGILHRDLKPANILLDAHGQPYVTDFGLAKRVEGDSAHTLQGTILGTPAYMAPEQAGLPRGGVTTAADVYSLGAILYELLTGRPPFRGKTPLETVLLALDRQPVRPRTLRPEVPRDLETICLKCLQKEPAQRYQSAADLADDLERYLAGEPIRVRPAGPAERLWRWCRRRPAVALLAVALVLSLAGGLGAAWWKALEAQAHFETSEELRLQAVDSLRQERLATAEANHQRERAAESFRQAHQVVNNFCTRVSAELANTAGAQPMRRRLLQDALKYYQAFLRQRGDDARLQAELADAHERVALIFAETGAKADALVARREAMRLYQGLLRDAPDDPALQAKLAGSWLNLGLVQAGMGPPAEALASYKEGLALYDRLLHDSPKDRGLRSAQATTYNNLANLHGTAGRRDEALRLHQKARALREELVRDYPRDPYFRNSLAASLQNLGVYYETRGEPHQALELYQQARDLRLRVVRERPGVLGFRSDLASSWSAVGLMLERTGQRDEALKAYDEALALGEELARSNPSVVSYQVALAGYHTCRATIYGGAKDFAKSLAAHQQAHAILEKAMRADPASLPIQRDLGRSLFGIGVEHRQLGHRKESIQAYRQARLVQEKLVKADPANLSFRHDLSETLGNLGLALGRLGQLNEARQLLRQGVEHERFAFTRAPEVGSFRWSLSRRLTGLASVERAAGQPAAAAAAVRESHKLWKGNASALKRTAVELAMVAAVVGRGKKVLSEAEQAEARGYEDEALAVLREALAAGYRDFAHLDTNPDLAGLRRRGDWQKLLDAFKD
jgi:tetratricopeptide (TPR) repeat protein